MSTPTIYGKTVFISRMVLGLIAMIFIAGCDEDGNFDLESAFNADAEPETPVVASEDATEFVEKDVEAPEVFSANEAGLWDGRPSLGGIWVAHPDVSEPERVIIRNQSNGQFVVGALFRRERDIPGPRLQLSSDAAQEIGVIAGAPVELEVVALRKEKIPVAPPPPPVVETTAAEPIAEQGEIEQTALDPIAAAEAAIETAPPTQVETQTITASASTAPAIASTLPVSSLDRPYVQAATFTVEANAKEAASQLSSAGLSASLKKQDSNGKTAWRVLVGPAASAEERTDLLGRVKDAGYSDAYIVAK